jgi:TolB protein
MSKSSLNIVLSCVIGILLAGCRWACAEDWIAYLRLTQDYWQVWIMDSDGRQDRQVTRDPVDKIHLSVGKRGGEILYNTNLGEMFIVQKDGKGRKVEMSMSGMTDGDLSPDGRQIVFSMNTMGSIDSNDIWLADADGKNLRKLTRMPALQHDPAWCFDNHRIVFLSGEGKHHHDLFLFDLKEGRTEQLTVDALYHFEPACSPKGEIAFSSNRTGDYEIWITDLRERKPRQVTNSPGLDASPCWSPDGSRIVFVSDRSGHLELWKVNRDGTGVRQLTDHRAGCRSPAWGGVP